MIEVGNEWEAREEATNFIWLRREDIAFFTFFLERRDEASIFVGEQEEVDHQEQKKKKNEREKRLNLVRVGKKASFVLNEIEDY